MFKVGDRVKIVNYDLDAVVWKLNGITGVITRASDNYLYSVKTDTDILKWPFDSDPICIPNELELLD